jgi:hypothetical protein
MEFMRLSWDVFSVSDAFLLIGGGLAANTPSPIKFLTCTQLAHKLIPSSSHKSVFIYKNNFNRERRENREKRNDLTIFSRLSRFSRLIFNKLISVLFSLICTETCLMVLF